MKTIEIEELNKKFEKIYEEYFKLYGTKIYNPNIDQIENIHELLVEWSKHRKSIIDCLLDLKQYLNALDYVFNNLMGEK